jgi:hypothetical protein
MRSGQKETDGKNPAEFDENDRQNPLTCIHGAYTLSGPQEAHTNGAERLMISHFLETLAEVAMSVASRQVG